MHASAASPVLTGNSARPPWCWPDNSPSWMQRLEILRAVRPAIPHCSSGPLLPPRSPASNQQVPSRCCPSWAGEVRTPAPFRQRVRGTPCGGSATRHGPLPGYGASTRRPSRARGHSPLPGHPCASPFPPRPTAFQPAHPFASLGKRATDCTGVATAPGSWVHVSGTTAGARRSGYRYFDAMGQEIDLTAGPADVTRIARIRITMRSVASGQDRGSDSVRTDSVDVGLRRGGS
jgi:hypothetical protein